MTQNMMICLLLVSAHIPLNVNATVKVRGMEVRELARCAKLFKEIKPDLEWIKIDPYDLKAVTAYSKDQEKKKLRSPFLKYVIEYVKTANKVVKDYDKTKWIED